MRSTPAIRILSAATWLLTTAWPGLAGLVWFDETAGGKGHARFSDLAAAYGQFMGNPTHVIGFNDLPSGTTLSNQYAGSDGVMFLNVAEGRYRGWSTIHEEGDAFVEKLTGYDGSYMPNRDKVVVKFDNNVAITPFTILFSDPVGNVGALFGMGVEGPIHGVRISVFDQNNTLISQRNFESWLWDKHPRRQNYESFFAVWSDGLGISRVEILNNARQDLANALVLDNLAFSRPTAATMHIPEPGTAAFLILGTSGLILLGHRKSPA